VTGIDRDFVDDDFDPAPADPRRNHGTNVAGQIGMEKGNGFCGVGIAYNSFITGG
jgi:kexin